MLTLLDKVATILRQEDVEGLIELGAPGDEYEKEAEIIVASLSKMTKQQVSEQSVTALVSLVWAKAFDLDGKELTIRLPALRGVARRIVVICQAGA